VHAPIETERLALRAWKDSDREPFARLNADPRVMRLMPRRLTREESDAFAERIAAQLAKHGFGLYAAELKENRTFIGFIGLSVPAFETAFTPCVEIGWRLAADCWNRGLAGEGARAVAAHAFRDLALAELVSFTVPHNLASRRVMEKLGMTRDPDEDFDHPRLEAGHPLRRHVLYRLRADSFSATYE
jgi:RimJ/RimL family protein N-acetyltransferase